MLFFFFFNDTATTEIYTLSLHDALPISLDGQHVELAGDDGPAAHVVGHAVGGRQEVVGDDVAGPGEPERGEPGQHLALDRKSTRLNSSHANISYAVFCLKKKNIYYQRTI